MPRTRFAVALAAVVSVSGATAFAGMLLSPVPAQEAKPAIVLVHGAFADGSCWSKVIPLLQKDGYSVTAVQNPLTSLSDDVATTRRAIEAQKGTVVLVGHSYGGAVISGAAVDSPNVKALVYVAAFAPEVDEPAANLLEKYPAPLGTALAPDSAGFLSIDRTKFRSVFCADVPETEASIMAATQKPLAGSTFTATLKSVAWKTIPSWYLVSQEDRAINPDLERFYAKRIKARTSEVKSSHVPFLSHPKVVTDLIEKAAEAAAKQP